MLSPLAPLIHTSSPHSPSIHLGRETSLAHSPLPKLQQLHHHTNDENYANKHGKTSHLPPSTPPIVGSAASPAGSTSVSASTMTLRQYLSSTKTNSPYGATALSALSTHFYAHQPHTPTMFPITPCGSVYNPQFSKERIMNIIKHKALQKLKKIESEVRIYYFTNFLF